MSCLYFSTLAFKFPIMNKLFTIVTILFSSVTFAQNILDTFTVDGIARNYILHIPQGYNSANAYPLVLNLHGYTSNANEQMNYSKMNTTADAEGFFALYPNGINNAWSSYGVGTVDDVNFLSTLIDRVSSQYNIDPNAVFSCGMSNGGVMSYLLACELNDKIAAVASVTGTLSNSTHSNCAPSRKVPVMHIHGTSDQIVNYNNGGGITGVLLGVEATVAFWLNTNNCSNISDTTAVPDSNTSDNCTAQLIRYQNCAEGSEVYLYKIFNGGHTWPNGLAGMLTYGNMNRDFDATTEIWNFFKRHKKGQETAVNHLKNISASVLPNPFENSLTVTFSDELPTTISIFDITGKQIFREKNGKFQTTISTANWTKGVYVVKMQNKNGIQTSRVVKE